MSEAMSKSDYDKIHEDSPRTIDAGIVSKLVGKVLTIYDAAYGQSHPMYATSSTGTITMVNHAPTKEEAIKSLITSAIWDWYQGIK